MNIKAFSIFLIFTQVNTVSSAPLREDSTLYFKLGGKTVSCDMVRNAGGAVCAEGGAISGYVYNHCPATCGVTDDTESESDMRFSVLLEKPFGSGNYKNKWKQCDPWVSKDPEITCAKCEKEGVRETCPVTCSNCESCQDSPLPFRFKEKKYNCDIVKNARADFCELKGDTPGDINTHCPAACDVPDCTDKETNMFFEILIDGELKWKQCEPWVNGNGGVHCVERCGKSTIADTCPVSCAQCTV